MRKTKDVAFRKWLRHIGNPRLYSKFKLLRNAYNKAVKEAKQTHFNNILSRSSRDPKLLWKNINSIVNYKRKHNSQITSIKTEDGKTLNKDDDISNHFNNFFVSVGENLASSIKSLTAKNMMGRIKSSSSSFF